MLKLILLRMWRERRVMFVLLFGMCLVTGFMALGPLYVQAVAGADFDQRIANAPASFFQVELRNESPFAEAIPSVIADSLGNYVAESRSYASAPTFVCGFQYIEGQPLTRDTPRTNASQCYRTYIYPELEPYFTLVAGRFPNILGASRTSSEQVETIITREIAKDTGLGVGSRFIMGEDVNTAVTVLITGIVEPAFNGQHPFWQGQTLLDIYLTPLGNENFRTDISFVVYPQAFEDWLVDIAGQRSFFIKLELDRTKLSSQNVDELESRLGNLYNQVSQIHPSIAIRTDFTALLADYRAGIAAASGPITLLSFLVLVLMVYNLVTTTSLILEQQGEEWAMIASRGGSNVQMVWIQFVTMLLLGLVSFVIGLGFAYGLLLLLSFVGPQAAIMDAARLGNINRQSVELSLIASVVSVIALTLPAWFAANRSLSRLKAGLSRPPTLPIWSRFMLDFIFLALGLGFMIRLYTLATGAGVGDLFRNPAELLHILTREGTNSSLNDPFNLAVPALILTGAALLWMRIFPLVMRLLASVVARGDGLVTRLAFWNVERDPAHYAQLVLLLIGTLVLGTASLSLSLTRDRGAWTSAISATGAEGSIELEQREIDRNYDWHSLPATEDVLPMLVVPTGSEGDGALIGIDLDDLDGGFGYLPEPLSALFNQPALDIGGLALPEATRSLRLDIYAEESDEPVTVAVSVNVVDSLGFEYRIPLSTANPAQTGEFQTWEANLETGRPPYIFTRLTLLSNREDTVDFQHVLYFDNLVAATATGEILLNGFEPENRSDWQWQQEIRLTQVLEATAITNSDDLYTEGTNSLRVLYRSLRAGTLQRNIIMQFREIVPPPVPVVVSTRFAEIIGQRSRFSRPLRVGDTMTTTLVVPSALTASASISFTFTIVDIIAEFPSFVEDDAQFVIADRDTLTRRLNQTISHSNTYDAYRYYDINHLWLDLADREPTAELLAAVTEIPGYRAADFAWFRYTEIQRDPLANSLTGILFAAFWISLLLSLLDFGFYMAVTIRKRALAFATLQAIGWDGRDMLKLLLIEQTAFITPALIIGVIFGFLLAALILPFLALVGGVGLQIPLAGIIGLLLVLIVSYSLILYVTASVLRRFNINNIMRFGE
jgi:ABC-type antimicrobial peptide transport system permease subunit